MTHVIAQGEPQLGFACIDDTIACAPKGGRGQTKQTAQLTLRFNCNTGAQTEALDRSRGGLGTKIVGICNSAGRLLDSCLVPGQADEVSASLMLLKRQPQAPVWVLADMACDARAFRDTARALGAIPVNPSN